MLGGWEEGFGVRKLKLDLENNWVVAVVSNIKWDPICWWIKQI